MRRLAFIKIQSGLQSRLAKNSTDPLVLLLIIDWLFYRFLHNFLSFVFFKIKSFNIFLLLVLRVVCVKPPQHCHSLIQGYRERLSDMSSELCSDYFIPSAISLFKHCQQRWLMDVVAKQSICAWYLLFVYHIVFALNFINQYLAAIVTFVCVQLLIRHRCSSCLFVLAQTVKVCF